MKKLIISALLLLPAAAYCQGLSKTDLEAMPGLGEPRGEAVQRPDARRIMSELSTALRLSSKQEDRISAAVRKKTAEFEKLMKEYDRNSAEEKKWRFKMNENRYSMLKINKDMPDLVREFLDDEQREAYDAMLEAASKPAAEAAAPPKPARKKVLVRRKKGAAAVVPAAEEDGGRVMVDREAPRPGAKKKRVLKKKAAPAPAPAAEPEAEDSIEDYMEDAGSYP
ncbi:MAG: hypothetical protein CVU79_02635 [Elusimicrobia bacterium HGW-Elusimicrobia-3]|nr:MAG: hypothetical protein CVU79_02635 [Elusimicrobia bacterium HGW-Elusimicrobia-3]